MIYCEKKGWFTNKWHMNAREETRWFTMVSGRNPLEKRPRRKKSKQTNENQGKHGDLPMGKNPGEKNVPNQNPLKKSIETKSRWFTIEKHPGEKNAKPKSKRLLAFQLFVMLPGQHWNLRCRFTNKKHIQSRRMLRKKNHEVILVVFHRDPCNGVCYSIIPYIS